MSDADLLREVFAIAKEHGLTVTRVRCGAVELIATPLVQREAKPAVHDKPEEVRTDLSKMSDEEALPILRKRSLEQFGMVKPDQVLLAMKGAL